MQTIHPGLPFRLKLFGFLFGTFGHAAVVAHSGAPAAAGDLAAHCDMEAQQALRLRAEQTLEDILLADNGWVRVHAAEALAEFGQADTARQVFLKEAENLRQAEYRVGIARVLAATALDPQQRQSQIEAIVRVFTDPTAADRKQAVESLAKLKEPLPSAALAVAQALARVPLDADSVIPAWALHYAPGDFDLVPLLLDGLQSPQPLLRQRCAYVLRWINADDARINPALNKALLAEAEGTRVHTFMLSAAASLKAAGSPEESLAWQRQLLNRVRTAPVAERAEASHALAQYATLPMAQEVLALLDEEEAGTRVAAARIVLAALRNAAGGSCAAPAR